LGVGDGVTMVASRFASGTVAMALCLAAASAEPTPALEPEILKPIAALPAHIAGAFQDLSACRQSPAGDYFVFDRRAHSVFVVSPQLDAVRKLIEIGTEPGRVLDPTAFDLAADGTFAVADAPRGQPRIQMFMPSGSSLGGFSIRTRAVGRILLKNLVFNGIASLEYTGKSLMVSLPEGGGLITEYALDGRPLRTFGDLRRTGHENDPPVHVALNSGIVLAHPDGGWYFIFLAGVPAFRKYDAAGVLQFERHIEGIELDSFIQGLPTTWKRQVTEDGEIPLVLPSVYAAAVAPSGDLWISLAVGTTYVHDARGEKRRSVQFRAAGFISPTGLSFTSNGRVLVVPGCYAFAVA
jgi:hypothetical protein